MTEVAVKPYRELELSPSPSNEEKPLPQSNVNRGLLEN